MHNKTICGRAAQGAAQTRLGTRFEVTTTTYTQIECGSVVTIPNRTQAVVRGG